MTTYIFSYVHPMDKSIAFVIEENNDDGKYIYVPKFILVRYGEKPNTIQMAILDSIVKWIACYRAVEEDTPAFWNGDSTTCALCNFTKNKWGGYCDGCSINNFGHKGQYIDCASTPFRQAAWACERTKVQNNNEETRLDKIANEIGFLIAVYRHFYGKLPTPIYNAIPRDVYCRWKNYEART